MNSIDLGVGKKWSSLRRFQWSISLYWEREDNLGCVNLGKWVRGFHGEGFTLLVGSETLGMLHLQEEEFQVLAGCLLIGS